MYNIIYLSNRNKQYLTFPRYHVIIIKLSFSPAKHVFDWKSSILSHYFHFVLGTHTHTHAHTYLWIKSNNLMSTPILSNKFQQQQWIWVNARFLVKQCWLHLPAWMFEKFCRKNTFSGRNWTCITYANHHLVCKWN